MTTWYPVYDSNINSDFANTLSPVGAGQILVNQWIDVNGGVWSTAAGNLSYLPDNSPSTSYERDFFLRPISESATDQRALMTIPSGQIGGTGNGFYQVKVRHNGLQGSSETCCTALLQPSGSCAIISILAGTQNTIASGSFTPNSGHVYNVDFSVVGSTYTMIVNDVTTSTAVVTISGSFSSATSGVQGTTAYSNGAANSNIMCSRYQTFITVAPVTDPGFYFSPFNWLLSGPSSALSQCAGAYFYFSFTGTSAVLLINTSSLGSNPLYIRYSIDGAVFTDINVQGLSSVTLGTGLANSAHNIVVYYRGRTSSVDSWNTPVNGLIVTGMQLSSGATTSTPTVKPNTMLVYGDSRAEGINTLAGGSVASSQDATTVTGMILGQALNSEVGMRAFSGMDFTVQGQTNVPGVFVPGNDAASSWNKYYSGQTLLSGGHYITPPTYIFVLNLGVNSHSQGVSSATEQAACNGFINAVRAAAPSATIFMGNGSYDGYMTTAITAAFNAYQAATPDSKCFLLQYGLTATQIAAINITNNPNPTDYCPYDGIHPDPLFQALVAAGCIASLTRDPGSSNVKNATTYAINGVVETGSYTGGIGTTAKIIYVVDTGQFIEVFPNGKNGVSI